MTRTAAILLSAALLGGCAHLFPGKSARALSRLRKAARAADAHYAEKGRYPDEAALPAKYRMDPWGRPVRFRVFPGYMAEELGMPYRLHSAGPDGFFDTDDDVLYPELKLDPRYSIIEGKEDGP